ncbi:hypothetical protein VOI54_05365 [Tamlana sp. 2201CG12-4]|uniref:hypothetical protein n=1 Tax=Tamlana sp. 2201CG12-4 TaxID=3112582 RepID=UPI002DB68D34|nr:hypothetical protein [Tamlana sp. 2201CG12-4]MEC3906436.1 hypothetical protein [Tamlana sp. 2201CG12-4]
MNDINWWLDVFKILIPIVTVLLAGFFALHRMKQNVKLEARLKWKEEFRNRIVDFMHTESLLNNKAIFYDLEKEHDGNHEKTDEYLEITYKLHSIYYSIDMMLDFNDLRAEALNESYKSILDDINRQVESKPRPTNEEDEDYLGNFYEWAKQIYNDDKYIDSVL